MRLTEQVIKDALNSLEIGSLGETVVPRSTIFGYRLIPTDVTKDPDQKRVIYRMNSLMDFFWFSKIVLEKKRFTINLHRQMCLTVMKDGLKEGIEIPRDHFKSTVYSECYPMWRALPFGPREEDLFSNIGYNDLYIMWLRRAHNQDIRILLVSETIKNAIKLGSRIANHYENNDTFRKTFPDILPTEKETWTADSLCQRRTPLGRGHGEGTFDFIGVGAALQSRHYNACIQDDLVGREARKSAVVMTDTIDYHQILVGATDSDPDNPGRDFDEIVVGNRWSNDDLNSHIRREEPYFNWTTHSALGGCCSLHPFGLPIFPEEFTKEKLLRWKRRLGSYHFSCQFLNYPIDPTKAKFNMSDFRYFHMEKTYGVQVNPKNPIFNPETNVALPSFLPQMRWVIRHHVADGDVEPDVWPRHLKRYMMVDPNHGGEHAEKDLGRQGRCRHAIQITGVSRNPRRVYFLDEWAEACAIDKFIGRIFFYAIKWKIKVVHVEAVAAQKFLLYHLKAYVEANKKTLPDIAGIEFVEIKYSNKKDAKTEKIDSFIPVVERHEVWLDANNSRLFTEECENWGQKKGTIDLLDLASYGPQIWEFGLVDEDLVKEHLGDQLRRFRRRMAQVA